MYRNKRIAVNVSTYNEAKLIEKTLNSIPDWVDLIVVVDDCSADLTCRIVEQCQAMDSRIKLIRLTENGGFGAVTVVGYHYVTRRHIDIVANLNGDGQMDVTELQAMIDELISNQVDMVKGDRLSHDLRKRMPWMRRMGGRILSRMTSFVTGYQVSDSQHTYHVIRMDSLKCLRLNRLYKRFGYPNDFLIECAKQGLTIKDHTVLPIYDNGARSELKIMRVWPRILWILAKGYVQIRAQRIARNLDLFCDENPAY
jgi:glycosyltransferase involved in cell wall biosynthesis